MGSLLNCQSCSVLQALNTLLFHINAGWQVSVEYLTACLREDEGRIEGGSERAGEDRGSKQALLQRTVTTCMIMQHNPWPCAFDAVMRHMLWLHCQLN